MNMDNLDRFKFRFFQKEQCKMFYCDYLSFQSIEECRSGNVVIMQSTGLKDKNGKLIYEGDCIVRKWNDENCSFKDGYKQKGLVTWVKNTYYFQRLGARYHFTENSFEYEIIGNIYENSEFLDK